MSLLAAAYTRAVVRLERPTPSDLDSRLAALYARGSAAHPDVRFGGAAFARHLALCGADVGGDVATTHAEDLFLVGAALAQDVRAMSLLRTAHDGVIKGYLRRVEVESSLRAEIQLRVWDILLVGDGTARPRLASYSGRGQVAGFIGICAQRIALTALRRSGLQKRALAQARKEAIAISGDPEMVIIKQRYRGHFERAVRDALAILDDRERMVFRMLVVDGHSVDRIADVYGVNQSSVSRWLARARQKVVAEARRLLRERLNVSEAEFESLANVVLSQIDLSVSQVLRKAAAT